MPDQTEASVQSVRPPAPGAVPLPAAGSVGFVLVLALVLFLIRFSAPADLSDEYHQERATAYVMDVLCNGNWICQYGAYGEVASKPPLFTWLLALTSLLLGGVSWFSLVLTAALVTGALSCLVGWAGRKYFGGAAGFLAAVMFLVSPLGAKQIAQVRIDGLFSLTVALTALGAFRSWQQGRGWLWFWLAAAVATLAKGPLGLLLGAAGLLAVVWERRAGRPTSLSGSQAPGVAIFLLLCGGWFAAAYALMGRPLIDVMVGRELVGHIVQEKRDGSLPFTHFYLPFLYVCRYFAPWVVLSLLGFWRIWKRPAADDLERRFERFVFCWFCVGLFVFSAAAHQRPALVFPLIPPAALLAGRELARLLAKLQPAQLLRVASAGALVGLSLAAAKYHYFDAQDPEVLRTRGLRELAQKVSALGGGDFPLTTVDSPYALQFFLKTKRPPVSFGAAAELLRSEAAAFVAVKNLDGLRKELGTNGPVLHELARWSGRRETIYLVSNHPRLEWTDRMICQVGPARIELRGIAAVRVRGDQFEFASKGERGEVKLSSIDQPLLVHFETAGRVAIAPTASVIDLGASSSFEVRGTSRLSFVEPRRIR